jgi:NTE family protein
MSDNRAGNAKATQAARSSSGRDQISLVADAESDAESDPASSGPSGPRCEQRCGSRSGPRRALVLGAGGVLGAAWMTGALAAAQEKLQCALGDVDLMLGTSAGSVLAAALRCGVSIEELVAYQRGEQIGALAGLGEVHAGPWPRPPRLRLGSPKLALAALTAPHRVHPAVQACAWLPIGRENHDHLSAMVHVLQSRLTSKAATAHLTATAATAAAAAAQAAPAAPITATGPCAKAGAGWVDEQTWVVAVDYDSGRRVVFGGPGAPPASLAEAVAASCSVPGWYKPVVIGDRRYVDGGVISVTSLGLLAGHGLDEICVLAPMASLVADRRYAPHMQLERRVRSLLTYLLMREVRELRAAGVKVTVLTPGPQDLAVMGVNLMDPRRRQAVLETSLRTSPAWLAAQTAPRGGPPRQREAAA